MAFNPEYAYDTSQDEADIDEALEQVELWREDSHRETQRINRMLADIVESPK